MVGVSTPGTAGYCTKVHCLRESFVFQVNFLLFQRVYDITPPHQSQRGLDSSYQLFSPPICASSAHLSPPTLETRYPQLILSCASPFSIRGHVHHLKFFVISCSAGNPPSFGSYDATRSPDRFFFFSIIFSPTWGFFFEKLWLLLVLTPPRG